MANFRSNSRYTRKTIQEDRSGNEFIQLRRNLDLGKSDGDIFVTIDEELLQRPDMISDRAYKTPKLWWVIFEFNGIRDPLFELKIGQVLRIPPIERVQEALQKVSINDGN